MTNQNVIEFLERKKKRAHPCDIAYYDRAIYILQERIDREKGCAHCIDLLGMICRESRAVTSALSAGAS